ncbi:MAG: hypothetical protein IME92_02225 [Proteobacteria bacterium]|nr:hypothetical protein [Pseudomonadota bacterium]
MTGYSITDNSFNEISVIINKIVHSVLKDISVEIGDIRIEDDGNDDMKFVITLLYSEQSDIISGSKLNELTYRARKKLVETGEVRYPFFNHSFPDSIVAA